MQKVAAIRTVSWISRSVAPAARASAICSVVTLSPLCCTAAAIASKVFSLADTGALPASARTCSTSAMPPGSWAAADAECEDEQYRQSFSADTYAAISSRSPRVRVLGPRSSTSASSLSGRPVSGRYWSSPRIPGSAEFNVMCGIRSPPYAGLHAPETMSPHPGQVGAHLPEPGRGGLVVAALAGSSGPGDQHRPAAIGPLRDCSMVVFQIETTTLPRARPSWTWRMADGVSLSG